MLLNKKLEKNSTKSGQKTRLKSPHKVQTKSQQKGRHKSRIKSRHKTLQNAQMSNEFYDLKNCRMDYKIIIKNVE